ncbi:MAG: TrkA C-terminal domain-containing protein, partial [Bacteroidales bacterium]|nr:TrkA C-terminal domain-containing protein [Bacteroidales bacterium]
ETFLTNFSAREEMERRNAPVASKVHERMNEYNVLTAKVTISPDFEFAGKTLREMPFRKTSGVNILKILRGTRSFLIPSGDCVIMPGDILVAVGTKEQLDKFKTIISENTHHVASEEGGEEFTVESISVVKDSPLCGQTLKNLGIKHSGCLVISVARGDKFIANPSANFSFQEGDLVWIAGDKSNVEWYK